MQAIILAGGKGTRLFPLTLTVPKPMVPVADKPFLVYLLKMLKDKGITSIIFSIGYLGEQIKDYFSNEYMGLELTYVTEDKPLGTGGAIAACMDKVKGEQVFVFNGDTFCQINLTEMLQSHQNEQAEITIALKEMHDFDRYGTVDIQAHKIKQFNEKKKVTKGLINTGTYCLNKNIFEQHNMPEKFSFETDFMQAKISQLHSNGFITDGYFIDIGIPEDYTKAQTEILSLELCDFELTDDYLKTTLFKKKYNTEYNNIKKN